jgi:serine/threonine-protein kinase
VLGVLGRGGMGIVYRARHVRLKRLVALKMIRSVETPGPLEQERFRGEAEAVARLQHPNVVQIFEVGEAEGQPFLALEYVEGGSLANKLAGTPLPVREAAQLAETIARAVHAAHGQGVIHRDLKPANVLLTKDGVPKITDFGLAKQLDADSGQTQMGQILGTPSYMAPEQARGGAMAVAAPADVYALGAILYEMLTGRPPFRAASVLDTLEQVRTQEPVPPTRLQPKCPRDLETICLKCLQKEAGKRYDSCQALADDLHRLLTGVPIQARPAGRGERLWRWCRRNPAVASLTAGLVVLLAALALVSTGSALYFQKLAKQEGEARVGAERAQEREAEQRQAAEANFGRARRAVDESFTKISESRLLTVPGLQPLRHDLLQSARGFYEEFVRERSDDPALRAELAGAQLRLGMIDTDLGLEAAARRSLDGAIAAYEAAVRDNPNDLRLKEGLGDSWYALGQLYWDSNTKESRKGYQRAAEVREELLRADSTNDGYKQALANAYNGLGVKQTEIGRGVDGLRSHRRCLELRQQLLQDYPNDPTLLHALGESLHNIAIRLGRGREEEKLALLRRSNAYNSTASTLMPHVIEYGIDLATNYGMISSTYAQLQRFDEGMDALRAGIAHLRRMARDNPAVPVVHTHLISNLRTLAGYQQNVGKTAEAQATLKQAHEVITAMPPNGPDNLFTRACVRASGARYEELAEKKRDEDLTMADLHLAVAAGFRDVVRLSTSLELTELRERQDFRELVDKLRKMPADTNSVPGVEAPAVDGSKKQSAEEMTKALLQADLVNGQCAIGLVQVDSGLADEAGKTLTQALALGEALVHDHPAKPEFQAGLAEIQMAFGSLHWKEGRLAEADQQWQAGLKRLYEVSAAHPKDATLVDRLAAAHAQLYEPFIREHLWTEADEHLGQAVELNKDNHWRAHCLAPLLLQAGDRQSYERHRRAMLEYIRSSDGPEIAERTARACLLAPVSGTTLEQAAKLAEKAIADKQHWILPWGMLTKSLADFRSERFASAVECANTALSKNKDYYVQIPAHYVLAMAQQGAGKAEEARKTLAVADGRFDDMVPQAADLPAEDMHNWLICVLLRLEAHERIPGSALPDDRSENLRRARAYTRIGYAKKAEAEFQAFIAGQGDQPRPWLLRAQAFGELAQSDRADADLTRGRKLLDQAPAAMRADASLWRDLALACKATGKASEAVTAYRLALTLQRKALEAGAVAEPNRQLLREMYVELAQELRAAGQSSEADALAAEMWKECESHGVNPLQIFKGHTHRWVEGAAVLRDGRHALSWGYDGFFRLWEIASAREIRTYRLEDVIRDVVLAADGRRFLSGSHDGLVRLWDLESGKEIRRYAGHTAAVLAVAFVPGVHVAVSGGTDGTVRLWDLDSGLELGRYAGHSRSVMRVAVTPDGRQILSASLDKTVRVWNRSEKQEAYRLEGFKKGVWGLAVSPDGRHALAGDDNGLLILWSLENGKEVRRFTGNPDWGKIRGVAFSSDGRQALIGTALDGIGGLLLQFDLATGKEMHRIKGPSSHAQLALMPDGHHVLTADEDKMVRVWSLPSAAEPNDSDPPHNTSKR